MIALVLERYRPTSGTGLIVGVCLALFVACAGFGLALFSLLQASAPVCGVRL